MRWHFEKKRPSADGKSVRNPAVEKILNANCINLMPVTRRILALLFTLGLELTNLSLYVRLSEAYVINAKAKI